LVFKKKYFLLPKQPIPAGTHSMGVRRGGQEGALAPPPSDGQNSMFFNFFE